ncbi:MAG: hypothetical protein HY320_00945 [Armatimonadetes bacterium]|nr:hypothetical protein [Armatimonadota bacterium]
MAQPGRELTRAHRFLLFLCAVLGIGGAAFWLWAEDRAKTLATAVDIATQAALTGGQASSTTASMQRDLALFDWIVQYGPYCLLVAVVVALFILVARPGGSRRAAGV